jgi:pilus assembly protein CpaB
MRARTLVLFLVAILLAGGTAVLVRSWLAHQRTVEAEAAPMPPPPVLKFVLVAHGDLPRGQILKPADLEWQLWHDGSINHAYIQKGTKTIDDFVGWVVRDSFASGDPITEGKIVQPGKTGFLAAALQPGMRAVSVPVTVTSGISGFIFPGDQVDILITHPLASGKSEGVQHQASETVLHDVRVLAVDQKLESKGGEAIVAHTATLEVTPKQSEIIAVAGEIGKLSLSLRSLTTPPGEDTTVDSADNPGSGTFTLDSEVSQLLARKDNTITVLRGTSKSETSSESQPASRGL